MEKGETGPKLKQLEKFLLDSNSVESKTYINDILSKETARPEELFVNQFLSFDFWYELGYSREELALERPAGITGRVEWTLKVDGKKIAIECKRPYFIKNQKEVKNDLDGNDIRELEDQIGPYLLSHEFIIFTNGFHWYFYSRESYSTWLANAEKKVQEHKPYFMHLVSDEIFDIKSNNYILNFLVRNNILESLSLMENKSIRHVITNEFFKDLKSWVGFIDSALQDAPAEIKARTTSLVNKLIFVRTMEGAGVIQNNFLNSIWKTKMGSRLSVVKFVDQIDEELSEVYDTELFTSTYVEDKDGNIVLKDNKPVFNPLRAKNFPYQKIPDEFISALLKQRELLNIDDGGITKVVLKGIPFYIRSLYWWKFEAISADILGKAYETYLAKERKKLGIYYTPHEITEYLTERTIGSIFEEKISQLKSEISKDSWDIEKIKKIAYEITQIKICDPSCGSGSFLIQAIRITWKKYQKVVSIIRYLKEDFGKGKATLDDYFTKKSGLLTYLEVLFRINDPQEQLGELILRHIYGNDKDGKAVDTAKLNIWLECLRLDPNSFRKEKLTGKRHVLPNLELNITNGDSLIGLNMLDIEKVVNTMRDTIKSIHKLKEDYTTSFDKTAIAHSAVEFQKALSGFADHEFIEKLGLEKTEHILEMLTPTHWGISHFDVFYDKDGNPKSNDEQGFDVIIGNPPWEILKPSEDEFFGPLHDVDPIKKRFSLLTKTEKNKFIEKTLQNDFYKAQWNYYKKTIEIQMDYFRNIDSFHYQSAIVDGKKQGSDINLYKLFLERYYQLLKYNGRAGIVLPSGFYTDLGSKGLRELIFSKTGVYSLYGFENRKGIFEEIHRQFKFITLVFKKGETTNNFKGAFYLQSAKLIHDLDKTSLNYPFELVKATSPKALSIMECTNPQEVEIIEKLFQHPVLCDKSYWNVDFTNEFHMTKHAPLFNENMNGAPLYEGKMIHQFTHTFSKPRYWIEHDKGVKVLESLELKRVIAKLRKETKKKTELKLPKIKLDFNNFRLVWRDITNATNERTLISTILPPKVFLGNTLNYVDPVHFDGKKYVKSLNVKETLLMCGLFNSFIIDFILRHKVATHANMFYVAELPIQKFDQTNPYHKSIIEKVAQLICTTDEFEEIRKEIGIKAELDESNRKVLSAKINALVGKIYGLTSEEVSFILKNFPLVDENFKTQVKEEFDSI